MKQPGSVLALGIALALAACNQAPQEQAPQEHASPAETSTASASAPAAAPAPAPSPATDPGPARLDGYGPLKLGSSLDDVRAAWKEPLQGDVKDDYCHTLRPEGAQADDVFLMIEGHQLVRYDVRNDRTTAPGGGKVGMTLGELQALYPERADLTPHKYDEKGHNLRVRPATEGGALLNFEIGGDGTVTAWRVGQLPQVDYLEGCS